MKRGCLNSPASSPFVTQSLRIKHKRTIAAFGSPVSSFSRGRTNSLPAALEKLDESTDSKGNGEWTKELDEALRDGVLRYGSERWAQVVRHMQLLQQVAPSECAQRWDIIGDIPIKGPWSGEEDLLLRKLVDKYGSKKWSQIATELPGRSGKQCRERWLNHLDTRVKKSMWTPEEDHLLCSAQRQLGNKWSEISRRLPGRAENAVKNRYNSLITKRLARSGQLRTTIADQDFSNALETKTVQKPLPKVSATTLPKDALHTAQHEMVDRSSKKRGHLLKGKGSGAEDQGGRSEKNDTGEFKEMMKNMDAATGKKANDHFSVDTDIENRSELDDSYDAKAQALRSIYAPNHDKHTNTSSNKVNCLMLQSEGNDSSFYFNPMEVGNFFLEPKSSGKNAYMRMNSIQENGNKSRDLNSFVDNEPSDMELSRPTSLQENPEIQLNVPWELDAMLNQMSPFVVDEDLELLTLGNDSFWISNAPRNSVNTKLPSSIEVNCSGSSSLNSVSISKLGVQNLEKNVEDACSPTTVPTSTSQGGKEHKSSERLEKSFSDSSLSKTESLGAEKSSEIQVIPPPLDITPPEDAFEKEWITSGSGGCNFSKISNKKLPPKQLKNIDEYTLQNSIPDSGTAFVFGEWKPPQGVAALSLVKVTQGNKDKLAENEVGNLKIDNSFSVIESALRYSLASLSLDEDDWRMFGNDGEFSRSLSFSQHSLSVIPFDKGFRKDNGTPGTRDSASWEGISFNSTNNPGTGTPDWMTFGASSFSLGRRMKSSNTEADNLSQLGEMLCPMTRSLQEISMIPDPQERRRRNAHFVEGVIAIR